MEQDISPPPLSLYLHIPFCLSKCGYCSFFSLPYSGSALNTYIEYLSKELLIYQDLLQKPLQTLYFGGGTPSLLSPSQIIKLCSLLWIDSEAEVTLEVNPLQITPEFIAGLSKTRINRLSLGVQSLNEAELTWLNRRHKPQQIAPKLQLCRDFGFTNLSLDLMYGLPNSNIESLKQNLDAYLSLSPQHISCYLLSLDEDCALLQKSGQGHEDEPLIKLPEDDALADQYELIRQTLCSAGYQHYEISNFALPGKASLHNICYWQGDNYLALGASAAGWISPFRYVNPSNLPAYYAGVESQTRFPDLLYCTPLRIIEDYVMMGLRMLNGIDLPAFELRFKLTIDELYGSKIKHLQSLGLLKITANRLALTEKALFVSNSVIGELIL